MSRRAHYRGKRRNAVPLKSQGIDWQREMKEIPPWPSSTGINLLLLTLLVLILFRDVVLHPEKIIWASDILRAHTTYKYAQWNSMESWGRFTLWDPTVFGGKSVIGDPIPAILNPLGVVFWFIRSVNLFGFYLIGIVTLASWGTYFWARKIGCNQLGAVIAAVGFALSGKTAGHVFAGHIELLSTVLGLPWVLYSLEYLLERLSPRSLLIFSLTLVLVAVQGSVQMLYWNLLFITAYTLCRSIAAWRTMPIRVALAPMASVVLGLLVFAFVSAAWWIPIVRQTLMLGARTRDINSEFATSLSAAPSDFARLVFPFATMDHLPRPFLHDSAANFFWETASYPGVVVLALAVASVVIYHKDRKVILFAVLTVLALSLALGKYSPTYWTAHTLVPGFSLFRAPGRFFFYANLGCAVLAGLLISSELSKPQRASLASAFLFGAVLFLAIAIGDAKDKTAGIYGIWVPVIACSITAAGFFLYALSDTCQKLWHYLIFGAVTLECLFVWGPHINTVPRDLVLADNQAAAFLAERAKQEEFVVLDTTYSIPQEVAARYGIQLLTGYHPGVYGHFLDMYKSIWKVDGSDITQLELHPVGEIACETVLDLMNVRYVVSRDTVDRDGYSEVHRYDANGEGHLLVTYERARALPRVYLTGGVAVPLEGQEVLASLCTLDPKVQCLSEHPTGWSGGAAYKPLEIVRHSPGHFSLSFACEKPGVVVVAQSWHPDWVARSGGIDLPMLRVNHGQLGFPVEEGEHSIEVWYRPWDFYLGLAVTTVALFLLIASTITSELGRGLRRPNNATNT